MVERFPDGFEGAVDRVERSSDKALYKYLRAHILGPYDGDCHAYLNELKMKLQENSFEATKICSDREDTAPDHYNREEEAAFWLDVSKEFLNNAHVAIFVFLDAEGHRPNLPERAFEKDRAEEDYDVSQDLNSSVVKELDYWLENIDTERERTLVLFEENCYEQIGSLVVGDVETKGVDYDIINPMDIDEAFKETRARCQNWAMNQCKSELTELYYQEEVS